MTTVKTAKQLVKTILTFNYDKTDESSRWSLQGCEFTLSHGQIGHNHPRLGWYLVHDFNNYSILDAVENIQWVLEEYGNEYTYQVLDMDAYFLEELGCGFSAPVKSGDHFIGTCCFREQTLELEKEGTIKILSVDPRG